MTAQRSQAGDRSRILSASAVMAAGTVVSRVSGFARSALLVAALGNLLHADLFNIANTVPNLLYMLLAGGILNAVLVPQLVRAARSDDAGAAYTDRVVTVAALFCLVVTVLLVAAAPLLMELFLSPEYDDPALAEHRASVVAFARLCLPQVFFYGMFVLVGQILTARGSFGPMMWAPIANNVVAVATLVAYLALFGPARGPEVYGAYTDGQELLLGLGSTLGIAVQLLVLWPALRAVGFRFRPRFDLRGSGLGHTARLALWSVLFVVVNQIAYVVVVRLASAGTGALGGDADATGYTVYSQTFLLVVVPHSVITVSLATAILPRLSASAADGDLPGLAHTLMATLRTALALLVPLLALLPVIALLVSRIIWGFSAGADSYDNFAPSLALYAPGLLLFSVHYLLMRGFYALERTRTVFWVQCTVVGTNVLLAVTLTSRVDPVHTAPALVVAYAGGNLVGSAVSVVLLRRILGGLEGGVLLRFLGRLALATAAATTAAYLAERGLRVLTRPEPGQLAALAVVLVVAAVDAAVFLLLARALRLAEVDEVVRLLVRRTGSRTGSRKGRTSAG